MRVFRRSCGHPQDPALGRFLSLFFFQQQTSTLVCSCVLLIALQEYIIVELFCCLKQIFGRPQTVGGRGGVEGAGGGEK